jgi:hypothetical protein
MSDAVTGCACGHAYTAAELRGVWEGRPSDRSNIALICGYCGALRVMGADLVPREPSPEERAKIESCPPLSFAIRLAQGFYRSERHARN